MSNFYINVILLQFVSVTYYLVKFQNAPLTHLNSGQDELKLGVMGLSDVVGLVGLMCLSSVLGNY